jgi:hypothetical protein
LESTANISENKVRQPKIASSNGHKGGSDLTSRNERVRSIIRGLETGTEITTKRVLKEIADIDPQIARELESKTTIISKLLRGMAEKGGD